jgi:hypothetical protein
MNLIQKMFNLIKQGLLGLNKGLSMGLPRLEAYMDGIQRRTYTIVAGGTGSGKTSFALFTYVYRFIADHLGDMKYRVVYYSMEMSGEILLAKVLSLYIFETYGIELSYKQIMSRQDILSEEHWGLIQSCQPWLESFMKQIIIYDHQMNSNSIYASLSEYAKDNGKFIEGKYSNTYEPNVKDELVIVIADHLGLINPTNGQDKKQAMDLTSKYFLRFRNSCAYSPVVLLQINRGQANMDRVKQNRQEIEISDLKNTADPSEDAEIILAIYHPFREKAAKHNDFDMRKFRDKYRAIQILKARMGEADKFVSTSFFGSIGYWRELPKPEVVTNMSKEEVNNLLSLTPVKIEVQEVRTAPISFKMKF